VAEGGKRATTAAIARLLARLSHRFADREAILWRAGYDEDSWSALEEDVLARLRDDLARGDPGAASAFVGAFIDARFELTGPDAPATSDGPVMVSSQPISDESVPTLPRAKPGFAQTLQSLGNAFIIEGPTTSDEDQMSITMSSSSKDPLREEGKPPRRK
jgi:hypothetical protein